MMKTQHGLSFGTAGASNACEALHVDREYSPIENFCHMGRASLPSTCRLVVMCWASCDEPPLDLTLGSLLGTTASSHDVTDRRVLKACQSLLQQRSKQMWLESNQGSHWLLLVLLLVVHLCAAGYQRVFNDQVPPGSRWKAALRKYDNEDTHTYTHTVLVPGATQTTLQMVPMFIARELLQTAIVANLEEIDYEIYAEGCDQRFLPLQAAHTFVAGQQQAPEPIPIPTTPVPPQIGPSEE
eukprot:5035740-Amphidinium_carterae.1